MQPDSVHDQAIVRWILIVDSPAQAVRIPQTIRPDLFSRPGYGDKRIVVGNAIAAVLADGAGILVFVQVRYDPQDFADEIVQPLRVRADTSGGFAGAAVPAFDIEHSPVGIAGASRRVEGEVAKR